jgi:hypothetical protein
MTAARHLIVWDLDRTLGVFDPIQRAAHAGGPLTVHLRPGIDAALTRLSTEGFTHVVLTLATPRYAALALAGTGLRRHFVEVACAGQRPKGDVEGISRTYGIPSDEVHHRMFFVGDHPWYDAPTDPRVVFHLEPLAMRRRAEPLADLILELRRRGDGSLRRGFDDLAAQPGAPDGPVTRELPGLGPLILAPRKDECPVIAFAAEPAGGEIGQPVTFEPDGLLPER